MQAAFATLRPNGQGEGGKFIKSDEYRTRDLWSRRPYRPELWLYRGRTDDVSVLATGELVNPLSVEQDIFSSHSHEGSSGAVRKDVAAAVLVGAGRWKTAVIAEPALHAHDAAASDPIAFVTQRLWPVVQRATVSAGLSWTASIPSPEYVPVTERDRPLARTQKGVDPRLSCIRWKSGR